MCFINMLQVFFVQTYLTWTQTSALQINIMVIHLHFYNIKINIKNNKAKYDLSDMSVERFQFRRLWVEFTQFF